jgi:hypothetical protein
MIDGKGAIGYTIAISQGTDTIIATQSGVINEAALTVTPAIPPVIPHIDTVTPPSGSAGTQVTISGTGFGAPQGSGYVLLGNAYGKVESWNDTQIIATVAPSSQSGGVVVRHGSQQSNYIEFIVSTPTIANVVPASGISGTLVTITGSGFGTDQGNGKVFIGNRDGVVTSWSNTQITAEVAEGAVSGKVQIIQNGTLSNDFPFTVVVPQITAVTPNPAEPGNTITIDGSGFGTIQGSGQLWLGSAQGTIVSWSDAQVVATMASNAISGIVKIQQNEKWSNALTFTVNSPDPPVKISPNVINMVVGDTQSVLALDGSGQKVTELTWTSSDTSIVSLAEADPPKLEAHAVGHATIKAGNASVDVTVHAVFSVPDGTVRWSNPGDGSGFPYIVPAVPMETGAPDIFAFNNEETGKAKVTAINFDGTTAWTAVFSNYTYGYGVPDFDGGLVYSGYDQETGDGALQRLNQITGQPDFSYQFNIDRNGNGAPGQIVVHRDGTIIFVQNDRLKGLDPLTGAEKYSIPMESGYYYDADTWELCYVDYHVNEYPVYPNVLKIMVAGDGYTYVLYHYQNYTRYHDLCLGGYSTGDKHLRLLRVSPEGNASSISIADWNEGSSVSPEGGYISTMPVPQLGGSLITNIDKGVLLSWAENVSIWDPISNSPKEINKYHLAEVTDGAISSNVETESYMVPELQRENGDYVGKVGGTVDYFGNSEGGTMAVFDSDGSIKWSSGLSYKPYAVVSDDGVVAVDEYNTSAITFDADGNVTQLTSELPTVSWTSGSYLSSADGISNVMAPLLNLATGYSSLRGGNPSSNGTAVFVMPIEQEIVLHTPMVLFNIHERTADSCRLVDNSTPVDILGIARNKYDGIKGELINSGKYRSSSCEQAFTAAGLSNIFPMLADGIIRQKPYDGPKTTISMYAAGLFANNVLTNPNQYIRNLLIDGYKQTPVCGQFVQWLNTRGDKKEPTGGYGVIATAQSQYPGTDVYINSNDTIDRIPHLTLFEMHWFQSDELHEVIHNLTGLSDLELTIKFDVKNKCKNLGCTCKGTDCISIILEEDGCANKR